MQEALGKAIRTFADDVHAKVSGNARGEPEAQLSGPVSALIEALGKITHQKVVCKAESRLEGRLGIPDFGILLGNALCGYLELKAPGDGADTSRYKGRNKEQWDRFKAQPNIIYTDGREWCLYQDGKPAGPLLRFDKDITAHGAKGVSEANVETFRHIVTAMLAWKPQVPKGPREQAELLAPLCLLLREDVSDALRDPDSELNKVAADWRHLLFPDATDERFADSYAQTVTFALLLARSEGAEVLDIAKAMSALEAGHTMLSRALQVLTDTKARAEIIASLRLLQRVINEFPIGAMQRKASTAQDPWLYFYEDFLAAYDAKLRRDSGVYYTPVQVVQCQVALVDDLLRNHLGKAGGFAHKDVVTLDPAVGTGTYLLGVIDHAMAAVESTQGKGAVAAKATTLAGNLYGFELMTGPYAVSELRLTRALRDRGASLPTAGIGIYLADTLESPFGKPPNYPGLLRPLSDQHTKALEVKDKKTVIVCLGNPPYDRHEAVQYVGKDVTISDRARTGGWVRWGDGLETDREGNPIAHGILSGFIDPAKAAGHGGDLKNLYNLYVYFWRWAIWKVFQHVPGDELRQGGEDQPRAGVVSFITAASYIRGDAFVGMREMLRRLCDEVYIIDLGGEGRGTRQDDNVFNIQTPVAICIAVRSGKKGKDTPAVVRYASIHGTREDKYKKLAAVKSFKSLRWKACPTGWHAPLRPAGTGPYFTWPLLIDLMPWVGTGIETKRPWVYAPDEETLLRRWKSLMRSTKRPSALFETRDRKAAEKYPPIAGFDHDDRSRLAIADEKASGAFPGVRSVAHRAYGRAVILADNRTCDYARTGMWYAYGSKQVYLSTLATQPLGVGPGLIATSHVPDRHFFRGSYGGKNTIPIYRDASAKEPNLLPGFLSLYGKQLKLRLTPESFAAYVYGLTGHPGFVERFWDELEDLELRIPLTLDRKLFRDVSAAGATLLHLHTFGERFQPPRTRKPQIPTGKARVREAISDKPADYPETFEYVESSQTLHVGTGAIAPVSPAVWSYEVSGLQVVRSWLGYRMKHRKGKKSSPLDDIHPERWTSEFTDELLRLLAILEETIAMQPRLKAQLAKVCKGRLLRAADLPPVPAAMRKPPRAGGDTLLFAEDEPDDDE